VEDRALLASRIGARLRRIRTESGRSLASVAQAVGISSSALSQIETGAMQPSVNRLIEIVAVLGAPVGAIFDDHGVQRAMDVANGAAEGSLDEPIPGVMVSQPEHSSPAVLGQGVTYRRLSPRSLPGIDLFESTYPPGTSSSVDGAMLVHEGYEVGSVVVGTLTFEFSEGAVALPAGASLAFWATRPHRVLNASTATATAIWLTVKNLDAHRPD
jgi:transcriptional regulator with XRE-family HTH domain